MLKYGMVLIGAMALAGEVAAAAKAFPTAHGHGAIAAGGRGGAVYRVTTLGDRGAGSLRACVQASGPRTCVFRVGGTILLADELRVLSPFLTIAGQTAPGGGIQLRLSDRSKRRVLRISADDVVVRHLRIRRGATSRAAEPGGTCCGDALAVSDARRVILDHVSVGFGTDENIDLWNAVDVTVQDSIIAYGLRFSTSADTVASPGQHHSMGLLLSGTSDRVTLLTNLWAFNLNRNPRLQAGIADVRGNLVFGAAFNPVTLSDSARANVVANTFDPRPMNSYPFVVQTTGSTSRVHASGNTSPVPLLASRTRTAATPYPAGTVPSLTAESAKARVLAEAGARPRDSLDTALLAYVRSGTGSPIDDPAELGGWPVLADGTPYPDADADGMSDAWETAHGLAPGNAADRNGDGDGDGYTNLEEFLNELAGDAG